jgi:hypothetical protein
MRVRGFVAIGLAVVVGAGALSACTSSPGGGGFCVPQLTVRPGTAHPGDTVTVSSSDVCDVPVPDRGWTVSVRQPLEDGREVTVRSADPFDGSWSTSVALPADFPVGETSVGIDNWDYSSCDDGASCAAASGDFRVRAPTPMPTPTPTPTP